MRDRLVLLKELLSSNGTIWISIDADESHYLKVLCDDIWGRSNFIDEIVWQRSFSPISLKKTLSRSHDTILVYAKNLEVLQELNKLPRSEEANDRYQNPDNDIRGAWTSGDLSVGPIIQEKVYEITTPSGRKVLPPFGRCWVLTKERFEEFVKDNRIWFGSNGNNTPRIKRFLSEVKDGIVPMTFWTRQEIGDNQEAKKEIKAIVESEDVFATPKPERLIQRVIQLGSNEGDIVLDIFGGSGTTLCVAHKMKRRWIGVELGEHCDTNIIQRITKVLKGEDKGVVARELDWRGGGSFKYYHLGPSIIRQNEDGTGDFNWSLGRKFIEESLLLSYDYVLETCINLQANQLFQTKEAHPTIGIQKIGTKTRVAIVSLNEPEGVLGIMPYEEITAIYKVIKHRLSPEYINIFTNRGIEIAYDSKPDDLEIIKVPHAIFAELEK
jgi:adenine-specific DNA-methyltransferase